MQIRQWLSIHVTLWNLNYLYEILAVENPHERLVSSALSTATSTIALSTANASFFIFILPQRSSDSHESSVILNKSNSTASPSYHNPILTHSTIPENGIDTLMPAPAHLRALEYTDFQIVTSYIYLSDVFDVSMSSVPRAKLSPVLLPTSVLNTTLISQHATLQTQSFRSIMSTLVLTSLESLSWAELLTTFSPLPNTTSPSHTQWRMGQPLSPLDDIMTMSTTLLSSVTHSSNVSAQATSSSSSYHNVSFFSLFPSSTPLFPSSPASPVSLETNLHRTFSRQARTPPSLSLHTQTPPLPHLTSRPPSPFSPPSHHPILLGTMATVSELASIRGDGSYLKDLRTAIRSDLFLISPTPTLTGSDVHPGVMISNLPSALPSPLSTRSERGISSPSLPQRYIPRSQISNSRTYNIVVTIQDNSSILYVMPCLVGMSLFLLLLTGFRRWQDHRRKNALVSLPSRNKGYAASNASTIRRKRKGDTDKPSNTLHHNDIESMTPKIILHSNGGHSTFAEHQEFNDLNSTCGDNSPAAGRQRNITSFDMNRALITDGTRPSRITVFVHGHPSTQSTPLRSPIPCTSERSRYEQESGFMLGEINPVFQPDDADGEDLDMRDIFPENDEARLVKRASESSSELTSLPIEQTHNHDSPGAYDLSNDCRKSNPEERDATTKL